MTNQKLKNIFTRYSCDIHAIKSARASPLLLALEDIDALGILEHQAVRAQFIDGKGILVEQELSVQDFPGSPRIGLSLHIVFYLSAFQQVEVLVE